MTHAYESPSAKLKARLLTMAGREEIGSSSEMVESTPAAEVSGDEEIGRGNGDDSMQGACTGLVVFPCGRDSRRTPSDSLALSNR